MALQDRAMLVNLTIRQWGNRKLDRKISHHVSDTYGTSANVGKFNKRLLPYADSLTDVYAQTANIRKELADNTVPWSIDGIMLLPSAHYFAFTQKMSELIRKWEDAVTVFIAEYPELLQRAEEHLGKMYNIEDYPSVEQMRKKFDISLQILPVPDADFRCVMDIEDKNRLEEELKQSLKKDSEEAIKTLFTRLHDRVEKIHERMVIPDAIFHNSLFDKLAELCETTKVLNITNDPELNEAVEVIEKNLLPDPAQVRADPVLRASTARMAREIADTIKYVL